MVLKTFFFVVTLVTSVSVAQAEDADPCLVSTVHNISHINERYSRLKDVCPYTDHRIEWTWFYAGEDPIVTFPPDYCRCGYKFPIWMNGTMPSPEDGIVNRIACLKFLQPCHQELNIQIRKCRTFFLYRLTPGPDDSGYCFGIDKPEPDKTPAENNISNATVTIQENTVTETSFISRIEISANNDDFNATSELVRSDGFVLQTIVLTESSVEYMWENLSSATNYTIRIYTYMNGERTEIASAWAVTQIPYRPASANINVLKNTVTNNSFSVVITFDRGSKNTTGEGSVIQQDGSLLIRFRVENSSSNQIFIDLNYGTLYTIEVHIYRHGKRIQLAQDFVFTKPEIEVSLESKLVSEKYLSFAVFECKFNPSPETSYGVQWFVESRERNHTILKTVEVGEGVHNLCLTEEDLVNNHVSLPFYVSCAVSEKPRVVKADLLPSSDNVFAGIKILTPRITMYRDETANILFSPTIPFGCYSLQTTATDSCNINLAITIPVSNNCTGISTRKCKVTISGKAGSNSSLQIQATEDGQYGIQKDSTHKVILRTVHLLSDTIWNDYTLPAVTVVVKPEMETYWRGKVCEALNDPHMFTFDKRGYEHHESLSDEYVLYTHESYSTKIHHKLERCNSQAMCNCGVAVRAGRDLYLISTCNNVIEIGYKQCNDGVLLVKQETDSVYTIYLPYGTYVKARLDKSPYSGGSMIVSVSVFPSVHDQNGRSQGLCGTLDNDQENDFHDRSGQTGLNRTDFILAWKVPEQESLFVAKIKSNSPWIHPACACTVSNGHVTSDDKCQLGADNSCTKGKTVGQQVCKLAEEIPISSFNGLKVPALNLSKEFNHKGNGTISTPATIKHWNSLEANSFCMAFLNKSRTFRLCKRVPHTDTDRAIETCTQDIIITKTTEWHKLSRQSMQDSCLSEIHRNKTVRNHLETPKTTTASPGGQHVGQVTPPKSTENTIDSNFDMNELIDTIEQITCPNECSEKGLCENGTCKCIDGFGGDDCSLDLKIAPSVTNFLHENVCDEKETPCTHVFIHGGFFASETVSCHMTTFETHAGKEGRQNFDAYVIRGQTQSITEVICPLTTPLRSRRSIPDANDAKLLSCYKVAVSNDGIHHGSQISMCVYNSQCQSLFNEGGGLLNANIKKGFCYINGKCVQANSRESSSGNYCLPAVSLYSWSEFPTTTETSSTRATSALGVLIIDHTENNWHTPVIILVACICCICVIVGIVVFIRKKKRRRTNDNSKENDGFELPKKHDADFDEETYAHINPTDVSDHMTHKSFNQTSDSTSDYYRLDKSNKEKEQYAILNSTQNSRREDGPILPERPVANIIDPYEKLRTQKREQRVYEKMGNNSRDVEIIGKPIDSNATRNSSEKRHSYIILQDNQANYFTPREGFDEATLEVRRNHFERGQGNDDFLEGYERPGQMYRRY